MKVSYDPRSRRVVVAFRGRIVVLPEHADDETKAIAAGEAYCREHGWSPSDRKGGARKVRSAW